jgi:hypothetical protein
MEMMESYIACVEIAIYINFDAFVKPNCLDMRLIHCLYGPENRQFVDNLINFTLTADFFCKIVRKDFHIECVFHMKNQAL